jgi:hypothetical protein
MKCGVEIGHSTLKIVCKLLLVYQQLKMATMYSLRFFTQNITNYSILARTADIKARFEVCIEIVVYFLLNSSL